MNHAWPFSFFETIAFERFVKFDFTIKTKTYGDKLRVLKGANYRVFSLVKQLGSDRLDVPQVYATHK